MLQIVGTGLMATFRKTGYPEHIRNFVANTEEVYRLTEIHTEIGGEGRGRRRNIEILNRSAIVLLVAIWEAFVEDLAKLAFDLMTKRARSPSVIPGKVLALAAKSVRESSNETDVWRLSGTGWKKELENYRGAIIEKYVGRLNTPKPKQVDELFEALIGIRSVSNGWKWKGASNKSVLDRLEHLVTLRGEIAHRVTTGSSISKKQVNSARSLVGHLSEALSNQVRGHLEKITGKPPFIRVWYVHHE